MASRRSKPPADASVARTPQQERGKETVRAILDATERLLKEGGNASAVKMTRVAVVAGVSVGSLYEYFPTKALLIRAVEEGAWAAQAERVGRLMVEVESLPVETAIVRIVEFGMALIVERGAMHGITAGDLGTSAARVALIDNLAEVAALQLSPNAHRIRPKNLKLAIKVAIKTVVAMTWLGHRDHEPEMATGELPRELGVMIARYLIKDPTIE